MKPLSIRPYSCLTGHTGVIDAALMPQEMSVAASDPLTLVRRTDRVCTSSHRVDAYKVGPKAVVVADCDLRGDITLGPGTQRT